MDTPISSPAPAKLYALLLKLRPIQQGTLMAFSGEQVHAAFLNWVRSAAPEVAAWLHEGKKRRLFTCSSLQFPLSPARMREAEYKNVHLPLFPDKTYTARVTLLLGELFPLLYKALLYVGGDRTETQKPPFMLLGKQTFLLEEVVLVDDPSSWTGFTMCEELVRQVQMRPIHRSETLTLEFASLTTVSWVNRTNKTYGGYSALLPLPHYIFPMLAVRWNELVPPALAQMVQVKRIEEYIQDDGIIISDHDLCSHYVTFTNHPQKGFIGTCQYQLRGPDEPTTPEAPLTVRQQILLLARFAFYSGIGYKTAMGLGQTRLLEVPAHEQ